MSDDFSEIGIPVQPDFYDEQGRPHIQVTKTHSVTLPDHDPVFELPRSPAIDANPGTQLGPMVGRGLGGMALEGAATLGRPILDAYHAATGQPAPGAAEHAATALTSLYGPPALKGGMLAATLGFGARGTRLAAEAGLGTIGKTEGVAAREAAGQAASSAAESIPAAGSLGPGEGGGGGIAGLEAAQRKAAEAAGASASKKLVNLPDKPLFINGEHFVPGPVDRAHQAAENYMREAGLPYTRPQVHVSADPARGARIAQAFDEMPHAPDDPRVKASYDAMINETLAQFQAIKKTGLKIEFIKPGQPDPYYASPRLAQKDVVDNNHLWVFPTEGGFGNTTEAAAAAMKANPLLRQTGEVVDGRPLVANDVFRIVHDFFGHFKDGNGFRASGEENAWRSHSAMYSDLARGAMTSETRGQNSWLNFGPHGEANRNAKSDATVYAPQKIGLLPQWAIDEGRHDPVDLHPVEHQPFGPEVLQRGPSGRPIRRAPMAFDAEQRMLEAGFRRSTPGHNGGPPLDDDESIISTRFPSAKKATEDPMSHRLMVDLESMKRDPKLFDANVELLKEYPNLRAADTRGSSDRVADKFVQHVKSNLLWIYDQIQPEIRDRSMHWYDGANRIVKQRSMESGLPEESVAAVYAALSPQKDWYKNVSLGDRVIDIYLHQRDFQFDAAMEKTAQRIWKSDKYQPTLDSIRGKTLRELELPAERAMWIRTYDQAHNDPSYPVVTPEGGFGPPVMSSRGNDKIAWGSLAEIARGIAAVDANGDLSKISPLLGRRHKVRNFYNNIIDPNNPRGDVTIDTHAVAAALLRPLSTNSVEVAHNFGTYPGKGVAASKKSAVTGVWGTYGLYAEAYRQAASERGILPRQMQSVTWEAIRGLFPNYWKRNPDNVDDARAIWHSYESGKITLDRARAEILSLRGGFEPPSWHSGRAIADAPEEAPILAPGESADDLGLF